MDGRTILFASIVGALTGIVFTWTLAQGSPTLCCADAIILPCATLLGSMFTTLFLSRRPATGTALLTGALHGLCVGGLAAIATWFVISPMTSDERVEDRAIALLDRQIEMLDELPEKQRTELEELRDQCVEAREAIPGNPQFVRGTVYFLLFFYALVIAPLVGLVGGWLGLMLFGRRLRDGDDPDRQENDWWSEYRD